ncbi:cupin domain-containing protein [Streptomyces viridochromogenes]|uniref:cupin domain-containing protein n=1 Tax=Streptomyces viridochromogenes TaxID=1938 RepID=UPI00099B4450|nr:cupin domain-containing protein [Streptomyces viridochromogenes]
MPRSVVSVKLADKLSQFSELWSQKKVAVLNDYEVKLAKLKGEFVWHTHEDADELFLVISGRLTIQLRDADVLLEPGELFVVPGIRTEPADRQERPDELSFTVGELRTCHTTVLPDRHPGPDHNRRQSLAPNGGSNGAVGSQSSSGTRRFDRSAPTTGSMPHEHQVT